MTTMSYLWTRGIYMQRAPQRELLTMQAPMKKRQWGCRTPLMNAGDGSPIHSTTSGYYAQTAHRTADAPPDLSNRPTQSSGRAMELIRQRRLTVVRRPPTSPLWASYIRRANEVAREMWAPSTWQQRMFLAGNLQPYAARTNSRSTRRAARPFDGNIRCGAMDLTAVRQDAAVHVGNESNPAGHDDSGVTKNCGAMGDEAGAPLNKGRDESSYPQPNRLEGTCCFSTCVDNGESLV
ncbi:hypothetical protein TcCL_ESM05331 [Trypanosoma cruzi]|nr:hypothetical protein TcCL_ESM05331 [Trypanosoma cruzi]